LRNFAEIGNSHAIEVQALAQLVRAILTEVGDQPALGWIAGNGEPPIGPTPAKHSILDVDL